MRFTRDHEFIEASGDLATVGVSEHAQSQLGDIVYVELPALGATFKKGDAAAVVESVKAASDMYSPVTGEVIESNTALADDLAKLSDDPFGAGWLMKVKVADRNLAPGLMDRAGYEKHWSSRAH